MTNEIRQAFGHPEERAAATVGDAPHDRISLRDHVVEVEIGAFQQERGRRQRVCFNIVVEVVPLEAPYDDDVDRILSYDTITEAIRTELEAERINLLETLAARIAERILNAPQSLRVFVRIEKLDRGPGALGVEIVRSRAQLPPRADAAGSVPHPVVVYLSNAAIAAAALPAWLDTLAACGRPVVFAVGVPDRPAPVSAVPAAQRRIDLLAVEQNAWVLAGRDRRCVVVGTRTELDWAMKHGQMTVWAPSKMVLDAVHGPSAGPGDSVALAAWFAGEMRAAELLVIGAPLPSAADIPARSLPVTAGALF
jgi:dihydroneopterin aldolase